MITAWAVTTGEAGMRAQARGLARAVADEVVEKIAPSGRLPSLFGGRWAGGQAAPWPDLIVSCGRRSARYALALRKRLPAGTPAIHIQDPRGDAAGFDLIVAMEHDRITTGPKVIKVATALHDLTDADLATEGARWQSRLDVLGRPLAGVLLGGSTARQDFTTDHGRRLLAGLVRLRAGGVSLAIVPSRRTPSAVNDMLRQAFQSDIGVFHWDSTGENPYRGVLGLADRLIVTSDSVSMISEALATLAPVEIFDFGTTHYRRFLTRMADRGWARLFEGAVQPPPPRAPINATSEAAAAVRALLQARTGVSG